MKIWVNNQEIVVKEECDLNEALQCTKNHLTFFAVALNGCVIPKNNYANVTLKGSDRIDIIVPMQGG